VTVEIARAFATGGEPLLLGVVTRPLPENSVGAPYYAELLEVEATEYLRLQTLDAEDLVRLVSRRLGLEPEDLPGSVADLVQRRAEGNPFFAEELVFALRDQGFLHLQTLQDGRTFCTVDGDMDEVTQTLPDTIQGLILARIDRLPPERQLILKTAAVIGRAFAYAPLSYVLQHQTAITEAPLKLHLDALANLELTPLYAQEPELTYIFKHIITQEVAYETLLFSQRRALHRTVAEWYERSFGDGEDTALLPYLPLLVHHYHQARDGEKERQYARLAGEQAAAQFANAEAIRYVTRALALTPEDDPAARYALLMAREQVYALQGETEAQQRDIEALEALVAAADAPVWSAEVALRRARYAEVTGHYPAMLTAAQVAIEQARAAGEPRCEAAGYLRWGRALWLQGDPQGSVRQLETSLVLARREGYGQIEADCLRSLGVIAYYQGEPARGTAYFEETLEIFRRIGDRRGEAGALNNLGVVFFNRGDYAKARAYYEQSLVILGMVGYRLGEGRTVGNLGIIAHYLGTYDEAITYYEQALSIYLEVGYRQGVSTVLSYLSLLFHHLGDHENALDYSRQALYLAQELNDSLSQGFALNNMGHALAGAGQFEEAAEAYARARDIRLEAGQRNVAVESIAGLACVRLAQGQVDAALAHAEEILDYLEDNTLDGAIEPLRVHVTCHRVLRAQEDPRADELLARAHALLQQRAATITDAALRQTFLQNVPAHQEILQAWGQDSTEP
jgi:predicted ATPase